MTQQEKDKQDILQQRQELAAVVQKESLLDTFAAFTKPAGTELKQQIRDQRQEIIAHMDTAKETDTRRNLLDRAARDNGFLDFRHCLESNSGLISEVVDTAMERYAVLTLRQLEL